MSAYVYVLISDDLQYVKIGYSNQVALRVRDLTLATPFKFHLAYKLSYPDAKQVERLIHNDLKQQSKLHTDQPFQGSSEWYVLTPHIKRFVNNLFKSHSTIGRHCYIDRTGKPI